MSTVDFYVFGIFLCRRDLRRAAVFLWSNPRDTALSNAFCASAYAASASSAVPLSAASLAFFTVVLRLDRAILFFCVFLAMTDTRFFADLMFGVVTSSLQTYSRRGAKPLAVLSL